MTSSPHSLHNSADRADGRNAQLRGLNQRPVAGAQAVHVASMRAVLTTAGRHSIDASPATCTSISWDLGAAVAVAAVAAIGACVRRTRKSKRTAAHPRHDVPPRMPSSATPAEGFTQVVAPLKTAPTTASKRRAQGLPPTRRPPPPLHLQSALREDAPPGYTTPREIRVAREGELRSNSGGYADPADALVFSSSGVHSIAPRKVSYEVIAESSDEQSDGESDAAADGSGTSRLEICKQQLPGAPPLPPRPQSYPAELYRLIGAAARAPSPQGDGPPCPVATGHQLHRAHTSQHIVNDAFRKPSYDTIGDSSDPDDDGAGANCRNSAGGATRGWSDPPLSHAVSYDVIGNPSDAEDADGSAIQAPRIHDLVSLTPRRGSYDVVGDTGASDDEGVSIAESDDGGLMMRRSIPSSPPCVISSPESWTLESPYATPSPRPPSIVTVAADGSSHIYERAAAGPRERVGYARVLHRRHGKTTMGDTLRVSPEPPGFSSAGNGATDGVVQFHQVHLVIEDNV